VDSECKFLLKDCEKDLRNLNDMAEIILNEGKNIDNTIEGMLQTAKMINEESIKYNNLYL
jgi:hypothetical protein